MSPRTSSNPHASDPYPIAAHLPLDGLCGVFMVQRLRRTACPVVISSFLDDVMPPLTSSDRGTIVAGVDGAIREKWLERRSYPLRHPTPSQTLAINVALVLGPTILVLACIAGPVMLKNVVPANMFGLILASAIVIGLILGVVVIGALLRTTARFGGVSSKLLVDAVSLAQTRLLGTLQGGRLVVPPEMMKEFNICDSSLHFIFRVDFPPAPPCLDLPSPFMH